MYNCKMCSNWLTPLVEQVDPHDFMDQWNPSPPWSDTTVQKVPDIVHQDLSPYVTTTPPTPVSLQHTPHSAFRYNTHHPLT